MADNLTNATFPSDNIDDTTQHRGGNPKAAKNLSNYDRAKGGKARSSQQGMSKRNKSGTAHKLTDGDKRGK